MHNGVTFNFGSAKVCSPTIFETCFSYDKDIWIAATDYYMSFPKGPHPNKSWNGIINFILKILFTVQS